MTRRFFDQIDDELRGLVGPSLGNFRSLRTARLIKVWYGDPRVHFEAQLISGRWAPRGRRVIEVGLHLEAPSIQRNEEVLDRLGAKRGRWARRLPRAKGAKAFGPNSATWRRLSELIEAEDTEDPDFAGEVADRLADYVRALLPLVSDSKNRRP